MHIYTHKNKTTLARIVFWASLAFTVAMATMPHPPTLLDTKSDKINHVIAFFVLTALNTLAYREFGFWKRLMTMAVFGGLIEIAQMVPALHRDAEWADWVADIAAALLASCLVALFTPRTRNHRNNAQTPYK